MSTTFKWTIIKLSCLPQYNQYSDVVFDVGWVYSGEDDAGNLASTTNNTAIHFSPDTQFTPFTELTKEQVIGWLEDAITPDGMSAMQSYISKLLNDITHPQIVNPELPWSNTDISKQG